ncbi:type II toxin-antitoxin system RelE/ParE family toxin [Bosea sp. (in: a-proteobacteria)]|jgi:toxin ParE1/3/4|uniref:type II toxin-antitoxin system RelE/ParE family toxin n=1 Tax=Bosea sp. (in: a-proteobacteria) TaxID=1871050 RepID=UPI003F70F92D
MALRLTAAADRDLEDIYVYGALGFGLTQAERYVDGLYGCLELLATAPRMGRERTEIVKPVWVHPHRSHLVVYEIKGGDVLVLRILHQRSDWEHAL